MVVMYVVLQVFTRASGSESMIYTKSRTLDNHISNAKLVFLWGQKKYAYFHPFFCSHLETAAQAEWLDRQLVAVYLILNM